MSKISIEGNASGSGTLTIAAPNTNSNYTLTLPESTGTMVVTGGAQTIEFAAGTASAPSITTTGDTNTGIFFPAADTIAFTEGGAEAMRIDSSSNALVLGNFYVGGTDSTTARTAVQSNSLGALTLNADPNALYADSYVAFRVDNSEKARITSSGEVLVGGTTDISSTSGVLTIQRAASPTLNFFRNDTTVTSGDTLGYIGFYGNDTTSNTPTLLASISSLASGTHAAGDNPTDLVFGTTADGSATVAEKMRLNSEGELLVEKTSGSATVQGTIIGTNGRVFLTSTAAPSLFINRLSNDGDLVQFSQANTQEGAISVSGNTITYGAFCGGHWTQLKEGRGYNPDIPRGTVMSSIGEMAVWKSVEWTETIEHPAIEAVEAVEAVLDENGNVLEPAVEAVEGKEAWTETIPHREAYLGNLNIGATFEEDGLTKTVVDDGNERLPKVKISDVVGDKAVYGVFQTWDEVEDMLISSLGAFVVRVAAGVTVEVGDLLESNGDGCAKVQDDDIIRSKTIGKVTSTVATDTYDDGSYTVPCVLYCG